MKHILFICAMEKEAKDIIEKLDLKEEIVGNNPITIYSKVENDKKITMLITQIGKQRTAISLTRYLENIFQNPDILVNIGYAGSTNLIIGSWINVSKSYNYEWNIPGEQKHEIKEIPTEELVKIDTLKNCPCYSAEEFVTKTDLTGEIVFDMELHSIYLISKIYGIPVLSLKKVSDNLCLDEYYESIDQKEVMELTSCLEYLKEYI